MDWALFLCLGHFFCYNESMTRSYKTKGIIIRRQNVGEADRLLDIYTPNLGRIKAKSKGVRKIKSKLGGHLELFGEVDLVVIQGKSIGIVTGARSTKSFKLIRDDLYKTSVAFYFCELVYWLTMEGHKDTRLYKLLYWSLETLDLAESPTKYPLLVANVELLLLDLLGFRPELAKCAQCGGKLTPDGNKFSLSQGGVICVKCHDKQARSISPAAIKVMRLLLDQWIVPKLWGPVPRPVVTEVQRVVRDFVRYTLERALKSEGFLALMDRQEGFDEKGEKTV